MRLSGNTQVLNLMDTNGRRSDVVNAYTIYMEILHELSEDHGPNYFTRFPNSMNQYKFYEEAIRRSPEVFEVHKIYDDIDIKINKPVYQEAIMQSLKIKSNEPLKKLPEGDYIIKKIDNGIEDRARHYTSNLVKIGFVDAKRNITNVGKSFVEGNKVERGEVESLLPINDINLIFLRQLLKLRVYNQDYSKYYSPMKLCLYILSQHEKISVSDLKIYISMIHPNHSIDLKKINDAVNVRTAEEVESEYINFENDISYRNILDHDGPLDFKTFRLYISNRKTNKNTKVLYNFYCYFTDFMILKNEQNLLTMLTYLDENRNIIERAFSFKKPFFNSDSNKEDSLEAFLKKNSTNIFINSKNINKTFYDQFLKSTRHNDVYEYGDTLMRLIRVTGIVSMENGIASLKYKDLWDKLLNQVNIKDQVFGSSNKKEANKYEKYSDSPFLNHSYIEEIMSINKADIIVEKMQSEFKVKSASEVRSLIESKVNDDFISHIEQHYKKDKVVELLDLFSDRSNDNKIRNLIDSSASIPTLYEFVIGLAWYHISNKNYEVFSSFNLTMNADFIPETHAGGGTGDIIATYPDKVVMLEATLMNKYSQKRGEWEPVLRHATNLAIDSKPKEVLTLFIADELDRNTTNIWRAVASVPLQSSRLVNTGGEYVENVIIMPIKNDEFSWILKNNITEEELLPKIRNSFKGLFKNFDHEWRNKVIDSLSE